MKFYWPIRVYYEDTDSGGVVYYANYLKFMERARTEYLRSLGVEQDHLRCEQGLIFIVHSVAVDYLRPARFNDALQVGLKLENHGRTFLDFYQEVRSDKNKEIILCKGRVKVACLDEASFRPRPIPKEMLREIVGVN